jgi:hypothetical protein
MVLEASRLVRKMRKDVPPTRRSAAWNLCKMGGDQRGYFLSISQQEISADIIQNSAVGNFSPKIEGTKTKAARCLFFLMFPFL